MSKERMDEVAIIWAEAMDVQAWICWVTIVMVEVD